MDFLTYLFHLPAYIGLPIIFGLGFVVVMFVILLPLVIMCVFAPESVKTTTTTVDSSTDGGAGACAVVCVVCI